VTARDRMVLLVVLAAAAVAGFWFAVLGPKRAESTKLGADVAKAQQQLDAARAAVANAKQAKARYAVDYATVARLGKAVPADDNVPSLVYQLATAADGAHIDFQSIKLGASSGAAPPAQVTSAQAAAQANASPSSGSGSTPAAGAAPATQSAAAALPPGAVVGTAGLPTMPFSFVFEGSFFDMERFLGNVNRFISVDGNRVDAKGRLLTVDALSLTAGPKGFPQVTASLNATAYLLPADEGLTNGATPAAPGAAQAVSGTGGSATPAPPAATATGVNR
jgi:hypothetical protein